jgi:metal-responsive CopG/Arc/MetJ family transcriptional regulator
MTPAGRPEIGQPVNIRLTSDLLDGVDAFAAARSISRAEAIRRLLDRALVEWVAS